MTGLLENLHLILPEIIILVTACLALLGDLFLRQRQNLFAFSCTIIGLILAAISCCLFIGQYNVVLLHGLLISDDIGYLMKLFIAITVLLSMVYAKHYLDERQMPTGDYYVLGLFSTLGMMTLVSAHSLLTVYLGLELLSLPLYAMTAIRRTIAEPTEAAMKYFVMGAIASGMLLYGISLIYGATGQLDLQNIATLLADHEQSQQSMLVFALVFIVTGIGFKLAAIPFHMWAPDVYAGAPTSVTLFISTAPKIAAMGMALRLLTLAFVELAPQWQQLLLIMALLSTALGNILAVVQQNLKRLFAYSAISHMGYAVFGLLTATTSGYAYALYYVVIYALMTAAAFGLLVLLSRSGCEVEKMDDLKGLNKRNPWLAFLMMVVMFSMAGVPPTVGFFVKLLVLKALVDAHLTWVAVFGLVFAVIGAYYYLRIVKVMYFDEANENTMIKIPHGLNVIFSMNCLALLYFGFFPSVLIQACISAFAG